MSHTPTGRSRQEAVGAGPRLRSEPVGGAVIKPRSMVSPRASATAAGGLSEAERRTALDAACRGDLEMISAYIPGHFREYEDVAHLALHRAANFGKLDVVVYLVEEAQVDKDAQDRANRRTPLHHAAEKGKTDVVAYLVERAGADLHLLDKDGLTPLDAAISVGQLDAARVMIRHLTRSMALRADTDSRSALEAALQERDWAAREALNQRNAREEAAAAAQAEAQAKEEALVRLREEERRRAEAEARAKDMEEELKVLAGMVMAQEEEEAATEPVEEVVNEEEGSRDKVEEQRPAAGTAEAEAVGVRVATSPELTGLVERLKVQLEKERAEKETLMSKLREAEAALMHEAAAREEAEVAWDAERTELQAALAAVRGPAVPEVVTGFVQRQKHSLGRDTWEDKFLVCQEGKLRYYNSDKEYLLASTNGSASPRRAASVKVYDVRRFTAAGLPSDDLVFVLRPREGDMGGLEEGGGSAAHSPLWFKAPTAQARDTWLTALQANGCSVAELGFISTTSSLQGGATAGGGGAARPTSVRPFVASESLSSRS